MELKIEEPVILSQVLPGGEIEMTSVVERFLKYVSFDTQSIENAGVVPSSPGQMDLAREVVLEMEKLEMTDVSIDENAYVMGTLPGNMEREDTPSIGFIAHFDTAREVSGLNVRPRIVKDYDGGDILLNREEKIVLSPREFPELRDYKGQDLIVTDGTTLLGADDKAGMAIILASTCPTIRSISCRERVPSSSARCSTGLPSPNVTGPVSGAMASILPSTLPRTPRGRTPRLRQTHSARTTTASWAISGSSIPRMDGQRRSKSTTAKASGGSPRPSTRLSRMRVRARPGVFPRR